MFLFITNRCLWRETAKTQVNLPPSRLDILTGGFWRANRSKQFISTNKFLDALNACVSSELTSPFPRSDLIVLLIKELSLQTHGLTNTLQFCPLFHDWTSEFPEDEAFGAKIINWNSSLEGTNTFIYKEPSSDNEECSNLVTRLLESSSPLRGICATRFVCLLPSLPIFPLPLIELAKFTRGSPILQGPTEISRDMSLVLVANKESLLVDPINWVSLIDKLAAWSQEWISGKLVIPDRTDALFRERTPLVHPSRSLSNHGLPLSLESPRCTFLRRLCAYFPKQG